MVILGCMLPILTVASLIPIMVIKRYIEHKSRLNPMPRLTTRTVVPRMPLHSVYITRVDYYFPNIDTVESIAGSDSNDLEASHSISKSSTSDTPLIDHAPKLNVDMTAPMISLPSLSSILDEFSIYADVIETQFITEAKQSSTFFVEGTLSSMDVNVQSSSSFPLSPSSESIVSPDSYRQISDKEDISTFNLSTAGGAVKENEVCLDSCSSSDIETKDEVTGITPEKSSDSSLIYYPFAVTDIDGLRSFHRPIDIETVDQISTSDLKPATSLWSLLESTVPSLGSLITVRLDDFPSVPSFLLQSPPGLVLTIDALLVSHRSGTPLFSALTRSLSAPASFSILEAKLEDFLPQRRVSDEARLIEWPGFFGPGELWDEEDDILFGLRVDTECSEVVKLYRNTWAAGIICDHCGKGDLWDDDDERRLSTLGQFEALATFASLSILSFELESTYDMGLSTFSTEEHLMSDEKDIGALPGYREKKLSLSGEPDRHNLAYDDASGYSDSEMLSSSIIKKLSNDDLFETAGSDSMGNVAISTYGSRLLVKRKHISFPESLCNSLVCMLSPDSEENIMRDSLLHSETASSRTSLMSFASVLDVDIHENNHACEDISESALGAADMDLEDSSYTSHIFSIYAPPTMVYTP